MRICFIISKSIVGGAQRFTYEQMEILKSEGADVFLIVDRQGWLTEKVDSLANNIYCDKRIERISVSFILRLVNYLKRNRIELLVCSSAYAGFYGRISALLSRIPVVYVSHGWSSVYNGGRFSFIFNLIERLLARISTSILCVSKYDKEVAIQNIGIPPSKCHLILNSIKPITVHAKKMDIKVNSSKPHSLLCVCRLEHPKMPLLLARAVANFPNVDLTIVGGGSMLGYINEYIVNNSVKNIKVIGELFGFDEFYKFDIFCLISKSEGLPISALEAMSSGLALILSNVGGCHELIENNGALVNNDEQSIKQGLTKCIENLNVYKENSKNLFERRFSIINNKASYFKYYQSFIQTN
jgi:glycosyltransferase involved in cell wall biosynthesis